MIKGKKITKQNFKGRDSLNTLLVKPSSHIPKLFDIDFFPYGGSDFTVSKGVFGKVTLLEIDHMERIVACEAVPAVLKY